MQTARVVDVTGCKSQLAMVEWGWGGGLFFFQAEDGIRYLVRSRGLGDVYKRQSLPNLPDSLDDLNCSQNLISSLPPLPPALKTLISVSYTHLTLPTSDLV